MKRFTDTSKWSDPWFRRLSAPAKMLWFYILDHCDHVGMIELDLDLAAQDCGINMSPETLLEIGDRVEPAGKGKLIVPKFIKFQVGEPSESCKAHTKIIQAIEELGLFKDSLGYHYPINSLSLDYPMTNNSHKEKEEDKDKEEEEDKEEGGKKSKSPKTSKAKPDSMEAVIAFVAELNLPRSDGEYLWYHWESNGYTNGGAKIKDWKMTVRKWVAGGFLPSQKHNGFRLDPVPAPSKPNRRKLPENWREIAEEIYGHPVNCPEDELTPSQYADIYRQSRS
jgi:hypothetical protein